jgi:hypothetical protein
MVVAGGGPGRRAWTPTGPLPVRLATDAIGRRARTAPTNRAPTGARRHFAYWNWDALSLVTISVPVSTFAGTLWPCAALYAVSMPMLPIFAGN